MKLKVKHFRILYLPIMALVLGLATILPLEFFSEQLFHPLAFGESSPILLYPMIIAAPLQAVFLTLTIVMLSNREPNKRGALLLSLKFFLISSCLCAVGLAAARPSYVSSKEFWQIECITVLSILTMEALSGLIGFALSKKRISI